MADKIKTGIFGGAFNPVHNGHISIAKNFSDFLGLERVIFIPTANPPHKSSLDFASKEDRLNMLSLALKSYENFEISDIEFQREEKSYTFDTLCILKEKYPEREFFLIVGADQLLSFDKWYRYKDILSLATLCACAREDEDEKKKMSVFVDNLDGINKSNVILLDAPIIRVSSNEIREKIKNKKNVSSLVSTDVLDYIIEKRLYFE